MPSPQQVRLDLENRFKMYIYQDVSDLVVNVDRLVLEPVCIELSEQLESAFDPDWSGVLINPGGTMGHHSRYLQAKARWLAARLEGTDEVQTLGEECDLRLQEFWQEWAGFYLTAGQGDAL